MKITFFPKTVLGKISVGSFVVFIATWTLQIQFLDGTEVEKAGAVLAIVGILAAFVATITGFVALFRQKDYSVLLALSFLLCLLISGAIILYLGEGLIT